MSSLAGVGISYMVFDFLAFYGLKLYIHWHGDPNAPEDGTKQAQTTEDSDASLCQSVPADVASLGKQPQVDRGSNERTAAQQYKTEPETEPGGTSERNADFPAMEVSVIAPSGTAGAQSQREADNVVFCVSPQDRGAGGDTVASTGEAKRDTAATIGTDEEFEVMGGGDAVLAAVIAAWLGLPKLVMALVLGFLIGTIMGTIYLIYGLYKEKLLKTCIRPALIGSAICIGAIEGLLFILNCMQMHMAPGSSTLIPWTTFTGAAIVGALCGSLFGLVTVAHRVSKPFPFGPSLAFGAAVAMFSDPIVSLSAGGA